MKPSCAVLLGLAVTLGGAAGVRAQERAGPTPLFVGTQAGCNAGEVTTNPRHKSCATRPIGSTGADPRGTPLYVGLVPYVNGAIVSTEPNPFGGAGRPIGSTTWVGGLTTGGPTGSGPTTGGTPLSVGLQPGCNAGTVTTDVAHLGCPTAPVGFTGP